MPILESYSADDDHDRASRAQDDWALDDELDAFPPERPQRISVPPIMLWGAMWLVAISVTVAATAALLLPRRLNTPPQRPDPPSPADVVDAPGRPNPSGATTEEALPPPPAASSETPLSESPDGTVSAPIAQPSATSRFPFRILLSIMGGCALTSLTVTLVLRGANQPPRRHRYAEPSRPYPVSARTMRSRPPVASTIPQPRVMVLPPEVVTPLDEIPPEDAGDLAAQLDIRRRYSLSSLIDDALD